MGHCHHLSNPNHFPMSVSTPIGGFQIGLQLERDKLEPSVNAASLYVLRHAMEEILRGDFRENYNSLPSDICRAKRTNVRSKLGVV